MVPRTEFRVALIRTVLLGALLLIAQAAGAVAQSVGCSGKNMLDELRVSDAAAHARIMAVAGETENANALFWKIERAGTPASYLFGTMHLTDDRINTLSPTVDAALKAARQLILEVGDLSPTSFMKAFASTRNLMMFTDGRRLEQLLSEAEYAKVAGVLQRSGFTAQAAGAFRPWVATLMLALSDCERRRAGEGLLPLDARLAKDAIARGVDVIGLESLEQQFHAMADVPEADQVDMLKASLRSYDRIDDVVETTVQLYLTRQLGAVWPFQLALAERLGVSPDAFKSVEQSLLFSRNLGMRDKALAPLAEGGVLIAVGALHLPGKQGLVALFREAGYTLTPVE
jgi:uncharacterized protein YbaP (TraB family)